MIAIGDDHIATSADLNKRISRPRVHLFTVTDNHTRIIIQGMIDELTHRTRYQEPSATAVSSKVSAP